MMLKGVSRIVLRKSAWASESEETSQNLLWQRLLGFQDDAERSLKSGVGKGCMWELELDGDNQNRLLKRLFSLRYDVGKGSKWECVASVCTGEGEEAEPPKSDGE